MKMVLPANLPVTFYPTLGDDTRKRFSLLEHVTNITDEVGGVVKVFSDGRNLEFHHSSEAKAIITINDILAEVIKATFYRIEPPADQPK
ncbi:hypothetical protein [Cohaesibacter celericrescens]|nr:hypothetical protein [Cohaesibacter celericrescens]